jgi:non-specific serine/threonine protein kinase
LASPERARLWGASQWLREDVGAPLSPKDRAAQDRLVSAARSAINDDAAFERAWQDGRALTLEQAIEHALVKADT